MTGNKEICENCGFSLDVHLNNEVERIRETEFVDNKICKKFQGEEK